MIFGQRNVHRMLTRLANFLDPVRVLELEAKLEKETGQTRAAEWEVAIGYALSNMGRIEGFYQQRGGNPDFIWTPEERPIIVEVTSVSDVALHNHNPVQLFTSELYRVAARLGISKHGALSYQFGSVEEGDRVTVAVPAKKDHAEFFRRADTKAFFKQIKCEPDRQRTFSFFERGAASSITYRPGQGYSSGGGYRSYTVPQTYRHAPVFNALKKKERQIKDSGATHPSILFICDNDCNALHQAHTSATGTQLGMRDIVGLFLNGQRRQMIGDLVWNQSVPAQASKIHAVIWISVKENWTPFVRNPTFALSPHIEYAHYADTYLRSNEFIDRVNQALSCLPIPHRTPRNAAIERHYPQHYGGWKMSASEVTFSALTLQKLLIGEISHEKFRQDHPELIAQLKRFSDQGLMIDFASIEACENEDDDWIKLRFLGRNPEKLFSNVKRER